MKGQLQAPKEGDFSKKHLQKEEIHSCNFRKRVLSEYSMIREEKKQSFDEFHPISLINNPLTIADRDIRFLGNTDLTVLRADFAYVVISCCISAN